jgi:hypothetical protein
MLGAMLFAAGADSSSRPATSDDCSAIEAELKKVTEQLKHYDEMLTRADETDAFYRKEFAWMNTLLSANAPISMPGAMKITAMALRENLVQQLEKIHVFKGQVAQESASLATQEAELKKKRDAACQHSELPLDKVGLDSRARLAVAACAYQPSEAPVLDPNSPSFNPDAVGEYLETNEDGNYGVSVNRDGVAISYSLLRFPNDIDAAGGLRDWQETGERTTVLDWGGSFPAFWRPQESPKGGVVARGQAGRWHLVISSRNTRPGDSSQTKEVDAAIEAMRALSDNAKRFQIFSRDLATQYQIEGSPRRLEQSDASIRVAIEARPISTVLP